MEKEILCTPEKEGFRAHYYPGTRDPDKAIISVGGASCDEKTSIALADGLDAMSGFARFALKHMIPAEKKYPRECEQARQDSFRRILQFLDEWA